MPTTTPAKPKPTRKKLPPSRGAEVCTWIEANCVHAEGDWHGQPFVLRRWQKAFIWRLYETVGERRRWRQALLGLPRGNGKTELAAAIGAYELFDAGRMDPVVVVAAASWDQADLVFGALRVMCQESPTLSERCEVFDAEIIRLDAPGRAYRVAAVAGTNEGQRPTCVIGDELHEWLGSKERVWTVLTSGAAKRADSLVLAITTAGYDRESVCYRLYEQGRSIEEGKAKPGAFLFEWHEAPEETAIDDPKTWKGCNPALEDFLPAENLAQQVRTIPEHEFRRYHLNQWVDSPTEWIGKPTWDALATKRRPSGSEIVLSLFGAYDRGQTALVACTIDRPHVFVLNSWERPKLDKDWRTPVREVTEAVTDAMERFTVREFAPCPTGWRREIEDFEDTYGETVVRYEITRTAQWGPACDEFEQGARDGTFSQDGSKVLASAIASCSPVTRSGYTVLVAPVPAAAAASVIAYSRAMWHAANPTVQPSRELIWI